MQFEQPLAVENFQFESSDLSEEHLKYIPLTENVETDSSRSQKKKPNFPLGTGICRYLLEAVLNSSVNLTALILPCNEGDNMYESSMFARVVGKGALNMVIDPVKLVAPLSWNFLYGSIPVDRSMW